MGKLPGGWEMVTCYERGGPGKARGRGAKRLARGELAHLRRIYGRGNVRLIMGRMGVAGNRKASCIFVRGYEGGSRVGGGRSWR